MGGRDIQSLLGAIPRRQEQSKTPKAKKKAPQVLSTPFQGDLEIRDFYAEDTNPAGSYYTPDSKSLGWTAPFEKKLRQLLPGAFQQDPPINPDFSRAEPPPYDQSMAEGWDSGWGNDDLFNLENPARLAGQQNVTEGRTPVTITTTTTSVDIPVTTLITTTEQFSDSASAYTSVYARQLAHEEEERRLSALPQTGPRVRPFTTNEKEWIKSIYNTVGKYAEENETMRMSQTDRMQENNISPFAQPHRENEVFHNIFLYKTTREDNGISPP